MHPFHHRDAFKQPELPGEISEVVALLKERMRRRRFQWLSYGLILCSSLSYLSLTLSSRTDAADLARLLLFVSLAVWSVGSVVQSERVTSDAERRIQAILSDRLDISVIGPLIDAIDVDVHHPDTRGAIVKTLTAQLSRLRAEDSCFLTEGQLSRLYRVLEYSVHPFWYRDYDADCVAAILHALEHIGDIRAVQIVKRLSYIASDRRVVTAAMECLPRLEARLAREGANQRLVRPSSPPEDRLVRPAVSPVELLVRPAPEP
jgi:hypothetical protein